MADWAEGEKEMRVENARLARELEAMTARAAHYERLYAEVSWAASEGGCILLPLPDLIRYYRRLAKC